MQAGISHIEALFIATVNKWLLDFYKYFQCGCCRYTQEAWGMVIILEVTFQFANVTTVFSYFCN